MGDLEVNGFMVEVFFGNSFSADDDGVFREGVEGTVIYDEFENWVAVWVVKDIQRGSLAGSGRLKGCFREGFFNQFLGDWVVFIGSFDI